MLWRAHELLWRNLPARVQRLLAGPGRSAIEVRWPESYAWPPAASWLEPLRRGFRSVVRVTRAAIPSPYPGVYPFHVVLDGAVYPAAVDIADSMELDPERALDVVVYFKLQFRKGGYGIDNVVPGGYLPASPEIYRYLPYLRALRDRQRFERDVAGRFGLQTATTIRRRAVEALES